MLGIPLRILPTADDADSKGRVLVYDSSTGAWDFVALQDVGRLDHTLHTHWQSPPSAPYGQLDMTLASPAFDVEPYSPAGGIRLVNGVRVTHRETGLSVAYARGRSEAVNRERAEALLTCMLDGLTHDEAEVHLLETSLAQALAVIILLSDAVESPLSQLISAKLRETLEPVIRDVARALPYFEAQGIWEGMAELVVQLTDIATVEGQAALRETLLERLPRGADSSESAGDRSRRALELIADGALARVINGEDAIPGFDESDVEVPALDEGDDFSMGGAPGDVEVPSFDDPVEAAKKARKDQDDESEEGSASDGERGEVYVPEPDFGFN